MVVQEEETMRLLFRVNGFIKVLLPKRVSVTEQQETAPVLDVWISIEEYSPS